MIDARGCFQLIAFVPIVLATLAAFSQASTGTTNTRQAEVPEIAADATINRATVNAAGPAPDQASSTGTLAAGASLPVYLDMESTGGLVGSIDRETTALEAALNAPGLPWYMTDGLLFTPEARALTSRVNRPGLGSPLGWDAHEYATLRAGTGARPAGELGLAYQDAEYLRTDPVAAAVRRDDAGNPYYGLGPEADPAFNLPLAEDGIMLSSTDFLDYDQERSIVYGHGHMVARLGALKLTSDRLLYNTRLRRLEAFGNVRVTGAGQFIEAQSIVMDTETFEGVAYRARGQAEGLYFMADPWRTDGQAEIRFLNRQESTLRDAAFSTCDFPVPHWRIQARDISVRPGDRIFARNAVLYVHNVPVLWLPFATQNIGAPPPWFASTGRGERSGYFVRAGYRFEHRVSITDPDGIERRVSKFGASVVSDYFEKRGFGYGVDARYRFDQSDGAGRLAAYSLNDSDRDRDDLGSDVRQIVRWRNNQKIAPNTRFFAELDWLSDSEIYFDVLDQFSGADTSRGRVFQRFFNAGVEYAKDDLYGGIKVRFADRLTRNRSSNPADPSDNDGDFDRRYNEERFYVLNAPGRGPDGIFRSAPGRYTDQRSIPSRLLPGVRSSRFRRVVERSPVVSLTTNRQQIGNWPLYLESSFDAFRAHDAGFNEFSTDDDATVTGWNLRQSLTHQIRLGSRATWVNRLGYGFGTVERDEDNNSLLPLEASTFPFVLNGRPDRPLTFVDRRTFLVGRRRKSFDSVDREYAHLNYESRLTARVTDALEGYLRLRLEDVTKNSLGEFYRSIGDVRSRDAIHPFPINERLAEAGANYSFLSPRLNLSARYGHNLESAGQLAPNEVARYLNMQGTLSNARGTLSISPGVTFEERQFLDPSDPASLLENGRTLFATANYRPVHGRNYATVSAFRVSSERGTGDGRIDGPGLSRDSVSSVVSARIGQKIGTKYLVEYEGLVRSESDTPSENIVRLSRDFHDLIATVGVGVRDTELSRDAEATRDTDTLNVRFDVEFKPAGERGVRRATRETSLFGNRQASESN